MEYTARCLRADSVAECMLSHSIMVQYVLGQETCDQSLLLAMFAPLMCQLDYKFELLRIRIKYERKQQ